MAVGPAGRGVEQQDHQRRILRLLLQHPHPGPNPERLGALAAKVQAEVALVLQVSQSCLQVVGLYSAGIGAVSTDLALRGTLLGQEAVAAAHLATVIARRASAVASELLSSYNGGLPVDPLAGRDASSSLLTGAEVQLVVGSPCGEPLLPYVPPPVLPSIPPVKPLSLDPQIENLLSQAQRIATDRPKHNVRLLLLGREEEKILNTARAEANAAAKLQAFWRRRQARHSELLAIAELAAARIQRTWRWYRFLWHLRNVIAAVVLIQSWWRQMCATARVRILRRRRRALNCFKTVVALKILASRAARAFRRRRRCAFMVQDIWRERRKSSLAARTFASIVPAALKVQRKLSRRAWDSEQERIRQAFRAGNRAAQSLHISWRVASAMLRWARRARQRCWEAVLGAEKFAALPHLVKQQLICGTSDMKLPKGIRPRDPRLVLFDTDACGRSVSLSGDRLSARHVGKADDLAGVLFTAEPLHADADGIRVLEVCLTETRSGEVDGLTLGVTLALPRQGSEPETADDLARSWSIGFDGCAHVDGLGEMLEVDWHPDELQQGDTVAFVVLPSGEAYVRVNGRRVASLPGTVAVGQPLYGVVDLLGNARAVSLKKVRSETPKPASIATGHNLPAQGLRQKWSDAVRFDTVSAGRMVSVSADQGAARHAGTPDDVCGVIFTETPLREESDGSRVLEVCLTEVRHGEIDGLTLGVTLSLPSDSDAAAETADDVAESWSIGFDGCAHIDGVNEMVEVNWHPEDLKEGDTVAFVVLPSGEAYVRVNGRQVVSLPGTVAVGRPLYGLVDLLGNARAVSLQGFSPKRDSKLLPAGTRIASSATPAVAAQVGIQQQESMRFDTLTASKFVKLSPDQRSARHTGVPDDMCGVIFTETPLLEESDGSRVLEVCLTEVRIGESDGLTLGVTLALPSDSDAAPETADDVVMSWSLGFDGCAHVDGINEMLEVDWRPDELQQGDTVAFVVLPSGEAYIRVNGLRVASLPGTVAVGQPLYGVVDLLGNARAVSLGGLAPAGGGGRGGGGSQPVLSSASAAFEAPRQTAPQLRKHGVRFDVGTTSAQVSVSADQRAAGHIGMPDDMCGVIFTETPLREESDGSRVLEVCLTEVRSGEIDGLTLGVTLSLPSDSDAAAETADDVAESWSIGFDGCAHIDGVNEMVEVSWTPENLQAGDVVAFVVLPSGEAYVLVNGRRVVDLPGGIAAVGQPLYGLVDLLGNARAVSLTDSPAKRSSQLTAVVHAAAPQGQLQKQSGTVKFDVVSSSTYVSISGDQRDARHRGMPDDLCGVIFTETPLQEESDGSRVLEVCLTEVRRGEIDGLTLGVTLSLPSDSDAAAETADDVAESWSIGFDGCAHIDGVNEMVEVDWHPEELQKGDVVGFVVLPSGEAHVHVNGRRTVSLPGVVAVGKPLYGLVDLLGNARAVSLQGEAPVRMSSKPQTSSRRSLPTAAVKQALTQEAAGHDGVRFDATTASRVVRLSSDLLSARHTGSPEDMCGVVFTDTALPEEADGSRVIEVCLTEIRSGEIDGLTLGVTRRQPHSQDSRPETADDVPASWSLGFDGCAHVDGLEEMLEVDWTPRDLRTGDTVGFVVLPSGRAFVRVNGIKVVDFPGSVDVGPALFGLVDLLGNARAVSF